MYHANANVDLMVENVIQVKSEIMINTDASVKNISDYVWWNYKRNKSSYKKL